MHKSYGGDASSYRLYQFSETARASIAKLITRRAGERMVRQGLAEEGVDLDGKTTCFRLLRCSKQASKPAPAREIVIDSDESDRGFSRDEVMAIAGRHFRHGRSRTARMSDEQRAARAKRIYDESVMRNGFGVKVGPEDIIERATNKFNVWNEIGSLLAEVKTVDSACLS